MNYSCIGSRGAVFGRASAWHKADCRRTIFCLEASNAHVPKLPGNSRCRACTAQVDRRTLLSFLGWMSASYLWPADSIAALVNEAAAQKVFESAAPSVVSITINKRQGSEAVNEATGSGFIWDSRGFVVTNYHCIQPYLKDSSGSQFLAVLFGNPEEEYAVEIVGTDPAHDLAVLKIEGAGQQLQAIKVGRSSDLKVGQSVYAIGNPYKLSKTLSAGVVSGLNRGIPTPGGAIATRSIQTDAAISSGNSGGPLLDSSGRLVGINTATFNSNKSMGRGSGVNFAISVDVVREIVPNLIVFGTASGKGVAARSR